MKYDVRVGTDQARLAVGKGQVMGAPAGRAAARVTRPGAGPEFPGDPGGDEEHDGGGTQGAGGVRLVAVQAQGKMR